MARLYANENFPLPVVAELRRLGHDVTTSFETGNAGQAVPDADVLAFAVAERRVLLTLNRRHFIGLHQETAEHAGIVVCTFDPDFNRQAAQVHEALVSQPDVAGHLIRVRRPA